MAHSQDFLKTRINRYGREINDPNPKFRDYSENHGEDHLLNRMRSMVRTEMSEIATKNDMESFEEANDFDVDEPWDEDPPETKYMKEEYIDFRLSPSRDKTDDSPPTQGMEKGENVQPEGTQEVKKTESSGASQPEG